MVCMPFMPPRTVRVVAVGPWDHAEVGYQDAVLLGTSCHLLKSQRCHVQDGNIVEAVVWECGPSQRHLIVDRVVAYALQRHLGQDTVVQGCAGLLDAAMAHRRAPSDSLALARRCAIVAAICTLARLSIHVPGSQHVAHCLCMEQRIQCGQMYVVCYFQHMVPKQGAGGRADQGGQAAALARQPAAQGRGRAAAERGRAPHRGVPPLPHPLIGGTAASNGDAADDTSRVARCLDPVDLLVQLEGSGGASFKLTCILIVVCCCIPKQGRASSGACAARLGVVRAPAASGISC